MYTFLAWGYSWNKTANALLTNDSSFNSNLMLPFNGIDLNSESVNPGSVTPTELYMSALPCKAFNTGWLQNATFAKCQPVNTTFRAEFPSVNGKQTIHTTRRAESDTLVAAVGAVAGPGYASRQGESCPEVIDVLHKIGGGT